MPSVLVVGGGLAGLSAAAALGSAGYDVHLMEARPFLGGRATSYPLPGSGEESEVIDNCQHVLLRCCHNLLDLYRRLNVSDAIEFHREIFFLEPGGRMSTLCGSPLPPPLHFSASFARLTFLSWRDKLALGRALLALRRERRHRADLDRITMMDWLREQNQPVGAIERFWRPVLVSAINEDLERMAAIHGFQVFWLGFLAAADNYQMGVPAVPLATLYSSGAWQAWPRVRITTRSPVERIDEHGVWINGRLHSADYYVCAVPVERVAGIVPRLQPPAVAHSPITSIHLWFDRPVTELAHAVLLDRTIQWMFNKDGGRYLQLVISASRMLVEKSRQEIIALGTSELAEYFPLVREARLEKAHVVKEVRATFSAVPGLEDLRPDARTAVPNLFLAGDWTRTGWPATMEGAVRSGYLAAEAITAAAGAPQRFLIPDAP